jgi:hypothetical protein
MPKMLFAFAFWRKRFLRHVYCVSLYKHCDLEVGGHIFYPNIMINTFSKITVIEGYASCQISKL